MPLKRILLGLAIGLLLGPLTMTLVQLYWESKTNLQAADIGTIIAVGGLFGVPVASIIALAAGAGMVEYRSGLGIEWGLVGALAAVLVVAGLGQFQPRPASILLFLFTLTGIVVERSAALIFKDTSYETWVTGATLLVYGVTAIALAVVYIGLLGFASSVGD
jgi:hypothetical protein